ncbi:MAG: precorrin-8X methylmutase [Candidatus Caldatribacteriaceae bacterium]
MNYRNPKHIERQSLEIIRASLHASTIYSAREVKIVERVIHATADFTYQELLHFSDQAVELGVKALGEGTKIITDVHMVEVGINKKLCQALKVSVICYLENYFSEGKEGQEELTRSYKAMRKAIEKEGNQVYVVGNAPTALLAIIEGVREHLIKPKLVVGVPVGFVGASEVKTMLRELSIPYITTRGPKGGTPVAVAIVNTLLAMALDDYHG